jgi:hypothetical protein
MTTRRRQSCRRKRSYETRDAANAALKVLIRKYFASELYMHAYKCRHCAGYHVGHRLGTGGRRR